MLTIPWREDPEQRIEVYEYTRHFFGAKSLPTCASYALYQVAKDDAKDDENLVKSVHQNLYMDDSFKSVTTPKKQFKSAKKFKISLARLDSI